MTILRPTGPDRSLGALAALGSYQVGGTEWQATESVLWDWRDSQRADRSWKPPDDTPNGPVVHTAFTVTGLETPFFLHRFTR